MPVTFDHEGYEILSLFSGAGGLDYGFSLAGFHPILALDQCPDAVRTYNLNSPVAVARRANIANLTPRAFLELIPDSARPIGLIGGPPCQGFSRGNVCADPSDPRNKLPYRYADLLAVANRKFQLHFFVFENVIGLASPKHAKRLRMILGRFESAGFRVSCGELNASDFSVPQRRRRLFIVGFNRKLYPKLNFQFPTGSMPQRTVADVIAGLPSPQFFNRKITSDMIPYHPNHWTMVPRSAKFKSNHTTQGRSFKQLDWNKVSPTVAYGNREVHVHPDGNRRLSILEAMLLQGFPQEYQLTGSLSAQVTQVSNAVPPPIAKAIAEQIRSVFLFQSSGGKIARASVRESIV